MREHPVGLQLNDLQKVFMTFCFKMPKAQKLGKFQQRNLGNKDINIVVNKIDTQYFLELIEVMEFQENEVIWKTTD